MTQTAYNKAFFRDQMDESYRSAAVVLPLLFEHHRPKTIVDVGCGVGSWLRAAIDMGISDVTGLDGDYVDRSLLMIPQDRFRSARLDQPISVPGRFDLAMSTEVAEHLPPERGAGFVADLCKLADVVLFSAAIPYQGGTNHINENWAEYWATHFAAQGYVPIDLIRPRVWYDTNVCWWYRQNLLVFASPAAAGKFPQSAHAKGRPLTMVHPELLLWAAIRHRRPDDGQIYGGDQYYFRQAAAALASGASTPPPQPRAYGPDFNKTF